MLFIQGMHIFVFFFSVIMGAVAMKGLLQASAALAAQAGGAGGAGRTCTMEDLSDGRVPSDCGALEIEPSPLFNPPDLPSLLQEAPVALRSVHLYFEGNVTGALAESLVSIWASGRNLELSTERQSAAEVRVWLGEGVRCTLDDLDEGLEIPEYCVHLQAVALSGDGVLSPEQVHLLGIGLRHAQSRHVPLETVLLGIKEDTPWAGELLDGLRDVLGHGATFEASTLDQDMEDLQVSFHSMPCRIADLSHDWQVPTHCETLDLANPGNHRLSSEWELEGLGRSLLEDELDILTGVFATRDLLERGLGEAVLLAWQAGKTFTVWTPDMDEMETEQWIRGRSGGPGAPRHDEL